MAKRRKTIIALLLSLLMAITATASAQPADISGHWAETQIQSWLDEGLASGYPDGTFKPNREVSRAEFVAMVNRAFGIESEGALSGFADVKEGQWFYDDVMAAKAEGYVGGYPDGTFKPQNSISRQEAASSLARLLNLDQTTQVLEQFKDSAQIPQWSRGSVGALVENGLMGGYPDNTFKPTRSITRAEAVATLDRARNIEKRLFDKAGTYGPAAGTKTIRGNVTISAAGVTLRNTVITGDLLLAESIGDGDVTLKNVTVKGTTTVAGGGSNSVQLIDCEIPEIRVTKDGVRVIASGNTSIKVTVLESGAILVEVETTGPGFETVIVSETIPPGSKISLSGNFESVEVGANVEIDAPEGEIKKLTLNAPAQVTGKAVIKEATINAEGASIEQKPEKTNVAEGVSAEVGGDTVKGSASSGGGGGGGGGGTGGGGTTDDPPEINSVSYGVLDNEAKTITVTDNPSFGEATIDVSVASGQAKLNLLFNDEILGTWLFNDGTNQISLSSTIDNINLTRTFDIMLNSGLRHSDILEAVNFKDILNIIKESQSDKDIFYNEIFPAILDLVSPEENSAILEAINVSGMYNAAAGSSKTQIESAFAGAISVYNNGMGDNIAESEFLSSFENYIPNVNNKEWERDFYRAIDFTTLYNAVTGNSRDAIVEAVIETNIFEELKNDKVNAIATGIIIYGKLQDMSLDTKRSIYGCIDFVSFLSKLSQTGTTKFELIDKEDSSLKTVYSLVAS